MFENKGTALVIAWPDTTARGDEKWYKILKNLGIVKNLNFKVGHAAIVLVENKTGELFYYDFGRYITPRGMGRARSRDSDPKLRVNQRAEFNSKGEISNLNAIASELEIKKEATHGNGPMFFSVRYNLDFDACKKMADFWVHKGSTPYGAIATGNNSCSRYVWQVLQAGYQPSKNIFKSIHIHETLFSSPISNVVNACPFRKIYIHEHSILSEINMNRFKSFSFFIQQISHNFMTSKSNSLPDDNVIGLIHPPERPSNLPIEAQWLGGIGEGAWYTYTILHGEEIIVSRYDKDGHLEFENTYVLPNDLLLSEELKIHYDSHFSQTTLLMNGQPVKLEMVQRIELILNEVNN
jgi:hypothetical protein